MEKISVSGTTLRHGHVRPEGSNAYGKWELSDETRRIVLSLIDNLLQQTAEDAAQITLASLLQSDNRVLMELYSNDMDGYLNFMVSRHVTNYSMLQIHRMTEDFCKVLIQSQDGSVLNESAPYDLKFRLSDGKEYWIDIQSVNDMETDKQSIFKERKDIAEKNGKIYRLCLYDDEHQSESEFILNANDFWALLTGFENTRVEVLRMINEREGDKSISAIIRQNKKRLLREWYGQD